MKREQRTTLADYEETKAIQIAFLKQCRRQAGIGQSVLVQKLRTVLFKSRSTCYKYVYGHIALPWHDAIILSRFFGVQIPAYENETNESSSERDEANRRPDLQGTD